MYYKGVDRRRPWIFQLENFKCKVLIIGRTQLLVKSFQLLAWDNI